MNNQQIIKNASKDIDKQKLRKEAMDNNFLKDFQSEDIQTLLKDTIQSNYSGVTLEDRWQDLDELDRMELLLQLYYNYGIDVPLDMDETLSVTSPQLEEILLKASKEDDSVDLQKDMNNQQIIKNARKLLRK